jgi:deoxyribodipyrimidine photolyase-related protein
MGVLRFVLGDQLSLDLANLRGADKANDVVLMVEVAEEATYVRHHKQKLVFVFSAMRHFSAELVRQGFRVEYVKLDDPENTGSFSGELQRALAKHICERVLVVEPGEWRVWQMMLDWRETLGVPVDILSDNRFYSSRENFIDWAGSRKTYRMEFFYREMRRKTGLLMNGDQPEGGEWNYDSQNRKSLPAGVKMPSRVRFEPDPITLDVLDMVGSRFDNNFGDLRPFGWGVTRADALEALEHFITVCLLNFGDFQDAMNQGDDFMYHSLISPYLNIGLLGAREVCERAEAAYKQGLVPLNAVEGFIRQILGWREFVRGLYWHEMPSYKQSNALKASRKLPSFFWTGETELNCLRQTIESTKRNAYAHHIQRLMITGNFALLAGITPAEIEEWYLLVYLDAYEWVELPNVHGMVMWADGGLLASKPYAASGAYIDRMSNYCKSCKYDPKVKSGAKACPFNALYWNFLIENETILKGNPRMAMPYVNLRKMTEERREEIVNDANEFLGALL